MPRNFVQPGSVITIPAPYDVTSGQGALVNALFGVATLDALTAVDVPLQTDGVWELEKIPGNDWIRGERVYWDDSLRACTRVGTTARQLIGYAAADAANEATKGIVRLNAAAPPDTTTEPSIANLAGGATLTDVINKVNAILGALRNKGIISP